ncbi:MAG: hypothetical protein SFW64_05490 [Alphaproteobacteria bacterium]|nr:hypothetical protein [Alphaproteobacteria bacterium]
MEPHENLTRQTIPKIRRDDYLAKIATIHRGEDPVLFPGEFVQYLLDKQNLSHQTFSRLLGLDEEYFRSNVFNTRRNDGDRPLPTPLRAKLSALTGKPEGFWLQTNFYAHDAQGVTIDLKKDISDVIAQYANYGGAITRAEREEVRRNATPESSNTSQGKGR